MNAHTPLVRHHLQSLVPPTTAVPARPVCFAYLDTSNIFLGGAAVSAFRRGMVPSLGFAAEHRKFDLDFRINFTWLRQFVVGDDPEGSARTVCVGSNKVGNDGTVFRAAERARWAAITPSRSASGREKEVDTTLAVLLMEDVLCQSAPPASVDVTLCSGDRDLLPAVSALKRRGYGVDVVGWEHTTSPQLRQEARRFIALDPYFDHLCFYVRRS